MTFEKELRPRLARSALVTVVAACALAALPPAAVASDAGDGALSPRLTELSQPALSTATPAAQAKSLGLASSGPGSLLRRGNRVIVEARFEEGADSSLDALREAGAQVISASRRYQTVTVAATPASLAEIGEVAGVQGVSEDLAPLVSAEGPLAATSTMSACAGGFGAATSEGDLQLNAMKARTEFGVDGSGVTVGILSDSFNKDVTAPTTAAEDVASGDLPGPGNPCGQTSSVNVISDPSAAVDPEPTDEGRGMAQIVHDLAPGASLAFATAYPNEATFAANIAALANAGAKVIVDDISYFDEPFFQEGPVGVAVSEATAKGVAYFSAAGNNNLIDSGGHNISSWEAPAFRDSGSCPTALAALSAEVEEEEEDEGLPPQGLHPSHCMDFNPGAGSDKTFGITVSAGATLTLDLQWAEPWNGVTTDLDAFLFETGGPPVASIDDNIFGSKKPVEIFQWENTTGAARTVQLVINKFTGGNPRLKFALLENGGGVTATEYPTSKEGDVVGPTIFGHNGGAETMSVGAIRFNTNSSPENFSSRGPETHYFGPVTGASAAPAISPEAVHKPDLLATDGGADTFFGSCVSGAWRFFGTSAAAPHAAAVAALELDEAPGATVAQLEQAQVNTATKVGAFPLDAAGAGLLNASAALGQLHGSNPGGGVATGPGFASPACPPAAKSAPAPLAPTTPISSTGPGAPSTSFALRPHRVVRTNGSAAFVSFRFRSDQAGSFSCGIDADPLRHCHRKLARWFKLGPHTVRVVARNSEGEVDPTPAVFHFTVKRAG
ncbi:MAG TPA: S8 family serine peptidase [Solirubrobacterales bacterium]